MHTSQRGELNTYQFLDKACFAFAVVALESGKVLYANRRILDLFDIPLEQQMESIDQRYLADPEEYKPLIQKLLREEQITDQELHVKTWQGRPIWILMSASLVTIDGHAAFQITMFDITQRKQTETDLLESENRFRTLFEQAAVGVALLNTQSGRFVRINQKYCDFLGYTMDEMLQRRFQDVTYPEDIRENEEKNAMLITGELRDFSIDKRYVRKDRGIVWGNLTGSPLWHPAEQPETYYHIAVVQDITRRKRLEEMLKNSNERFDLAVRSAKMGVWDWDIPKNEMIWNDQMYKMYGVKKTDFGGAYEAWLKGVHPEDIAFSNEAVRSALCGEREYDTEFRIIHPDGSLHYIKAFGLVVRDAEGNPLRLTGIDYDITDRKQQELELDHARKLANSVAAGVAHELNTPLQIITGYSERLLKEMQKEGSLTGERFENNINTINRNAWRMAEIISSLQHYIHPEAETLSQNNLNDMVHDALNLLEHQLKVNQHLIVEVDLAPVLPPLNCEQNKIILMLVHLISNACDAMPYGGRLRIESTFQPKPPGLILQVEDEGEGIPDAILPRIFDPFFTTKPVGKGVGLGLSIVQGIVHAHHGEIKVESNRGKGTRFTISLPLDAVDLPSKDDNHPKLERRITGRYDS